MKQQRPNKRKILNFSVNRGLQVRMIGGIAIVMSCSLLLCALIYFYFANREITDSFRLFHIKARNFLDFLLPVVAGSFFLSLACGLIAVLFLPKSIAGGLYRLEQEVKRIAAGDLSGKITLRHGDQVVPLADQINLLLESWRERVVLLRNALEKARNICDTDEPSAEQMKELNKVLQQASGELHKFNLSG